MQAEAFWDGVAKSYAKRPIENPDQHERTVDRAASYLTPDAEVLEVGCGTGTIALKLAPHAGHVLATDLSGALLEIARERAAETEVSNVRFAQHRIEDLPEGAYDAVMAFNVLHLMPNLEGAVKELARRVKPGGVLIAKTGVMADTFVGQMLRPVIGLMRLVGKAPYVGFLTSRRVQALIEAEGLQVVERETMGGKVAVQFLVARKPFK